MKFYPITIDGVPQLARTQKEAAQHGPVADPIDIDVAQQPLMDHLNDLMRHAAGYDATNLVGFIHDTPAVLPEPVNNVSTLPLIGPNGRCISCGKTPAGQQAMIDSMDQDAIIERLEAGPPWMRQNVKDSL
jgi:hypothetical protein